jgi:hypothetical protein
MLQPTIVKERVRALPEEDETAPIVGLPRREKDRLWEREAQGKAQEIRAKSKAKQRYARHICRRVYDICLGSTA